MYSTSTYKKNYWKIRSNELNESIEDLFSENSEFSKEIIKKRILEYLEEEKLKYYNIEVNNY